MMSTIIRPQVNPRYLCFCGKVHVKKLALCIGIFRFVFSIAFMALSYSRSRFWNILQLQSENEQMHPLVIRLIDLVPYWLLIEAFIYFWVHAAVIYGSLARKPWAYWPQLLLDGVVLVQHFLLTKFAIIILIWFHFLHDTLIDHMEKKFQARSKTPDRIIKFFLKEDPNDWFTEIMAINDSLPSVWLIVPILIVVWVLLTIALTFCLFVTWRAYRCMKEELMLEADIMKDVNESKKLLKESKFV